MSQHPSSSFDPLQCLSSIFFSLSKSFSQDISDDIFTVYCCQHYVGPTEETVNDFWRMIWEKDCTCIVALTNIVELGKASTSLFKRIF